MKYVDVIKALADDNRLAILCYLQTGAKCVCEIEQVLTITQSATSKHLNKLRMAGLIVAEKRAQWVHYSIPESVYKEYSFLESLLAGARKEYVFDETNIKKCSDFNKE
ncbi:MAG: metalloregulator ArsR/SmtB family transcription factor [Pelosinus sp.]|nr:metalloregulator ArsR/SmtB family transcription factor [Pelosinus sp.]